MERDLKNVNNKTDGTSADDQKGELYSRTYSLVIAWFAR